MIYPAIICGFPAIGKSYVAKNNESTLKILDSDSSVYHWVRVDTVNKYLNPYWPANYIRHIEQSRQLYDIILVSTHESIRNGLRNAGVRFITAYPDRSLKDEWMDRITNRGYNGFEPSVLESNWDEWIDQCESEPGEKIVIESGRYLSDYIIY